MLLGCGMAEGETISEMLGWLFAVEPTAKTDELIRFQQAAMEWHNCQEVGA